MNWYITKCIQEHSVCHVSLVNHPRQSPLHYFSQIAKLFSPQEDLHMLKGFYFTLIFKWSGCFKWSINVVHGLELKRDSMCLQMGRVLFNCIFCLYQPVSICHHSLPPPLSSYLWCITDILSLSPHTIEHIPTYSFLKSKTNPWFLTWVLYQLNSSRKNGNEMLSNMKTQEEFCDVTLISEDGGRIRAHKEICSKVKKKERSIK